MKKVLVRLLSIALIGYSQVILNLSQYSDLDKEYSQFTIGIYSVIPTLATKKSFALNTSQLQSYKTQTSFSKDLLPTDVDFVDFVYNNDNIDTKLLFGKKLPTNMYQIHKNSFYYYDYNNLEEKIGFGFDNSLTFDRTEGKFYTWAFSPNVSECQKLTLGLFG